jgi:hypothetical protein
VRAQGVHRDPQRVLDRGDVVPDVGEQQPALHAGHGRLRQPRQIGIRADKSLVLQAFQPGFEVRFPLAVGLVQQYAHPRVVAEFAGDIAERAGDRPGLGAVQAEDFLGPAVEIRPRGERPDRRLIRQYSFQVPLDDRLDQLVLVLEVVVHLRFPGPARGQHLVDARVRDPVHVHQLRRRVHDRLPRPAAASGARSLRLHVLNSTVGRTVPFSTIGGL